MFRFSLVPILFGLTLAQADVLLRGFEGGVDSLDSPTPWGSDSSKAVQSYETTHPINGLRSVAVDYTLDPQTTPDPFVGGFTSFFSTLDLRSATGIHVKFKTDRAVRLRVALESSWHPLAHTSHGITWGWQLDLPIGTTDTTLELSKAQLPDWASTGNPYLFGTSPPLLDILNGVGGISLNLQSATSPLISKLTGKLLWDDISLTGVASTTPGTEAKLLVLRDSYQDTLVADHPDSVIGSWHWANGGSTASLKPNGDKPIWYSKDYRFDFHFGDLPGAAGWSAFAGFGLFLGHDSASDLRGTTRWEFAYKTPETRRSAWIHLSSNRYPKELVDSGVTYGWSDTFKTSTGPWEAVVLYTKDLQPPAWAAGRTRLLALLPPVDSILKGVQGFEISPDADFLSDGSVNPAKATSYLQVNHFLAVGIDKWIPSPPRSQPTADPQFVLQEFESTADSTQVSAIWGNDSSKTKLVWDRISPIQGATSPRLDYTLDPRTTPNPWVGAFTWLGRLNDMRGAKGIHIKLKSSVAGTRIGLIPASNWYPLPHENTAIQWQWEFPLPQGTLDTTLYFSDAKLPSWASSSRPDLVASAPPISEILQGVTGLIFNVSSVQATVVAPSSGSVEWDSITLVGVDHPTTGAEPKKLIWYNEDRPVVANHPDSALGTWHWSNPRSKAKLVRNTVHPTWGFSDLRFDFEFAPDSGKSYSAFAGFGLGMRGDSAWDLRGTTRLEFAEKTPDASRRVRVNLASNRYPKELVDSGVTYGWDDVFHSTEQPWSGQVLSISKMAPPTWITSKRLLDQLPPLDSVLKGVTGIEFSPQADFLSASSVDPATAKAFVQVAAFHFVGIDQWIPAPPLPAAPPKPKDSASALVRAFEIGADSLSGDGPYANDSSKAILSLDSANPIGGKSSSRMDYALDPRTTRYPWAGFFNWFKGPLDLRAAKGVRIKLRSSDADRQIEIHLSSNWYPLPHSNRGVVYRWAFPARTGTIDTLLRLSDAAIPDWAPTTEPYLTNSVPQKPDILRGAYGLNIDVRPGTMPTDAVHSGYLLLDDISIVGSDTLKPGSDPKILVLRDYFDSAIAAKPDSVPSTWRWSSPRSSASVKRNAYRTVWGPVDIRCDFGFANDSAQPYSAYVGMGVGLRGDSAWDLRGTTRWEFAQNTPDSLRNVWIHLASNRYPKELVDSGVVYGWNDVFPGSFRQWEGQVLYTDSLKPPTWASGRKRLLSLLPPVDSILKGVTGFELSPQPDWDANGAVVAATAKSFFQINHILAVGVDHWIPSPIKQIPTSLGNRSPNRAWILTGRILSNTGDRDLEVMNLQGRAVVRLAPGTSASVPLGCHFVRQGREVHPLFVP